MQIDRVQYNATLASHYLEVIREMRSRIKDCVIERDDITYIQNPEIEAEYMKVIGGFEVELAQAEIAERRAKKKLALCKNCIIQDSEINENVIDEILDDEFERWINEEESSGAPVSAASGSESKQFGALEFDPEKLKRLYRTLCKHLHPDLVADLTEQQKQDFEAVQIAYDSCDIVALVAYCDLYGLDTKDRYETMSGPQIAATIEELKAVEASQIETLRKLKDSFPYSMREKMKDPGWVEQTVSGLKSRRERAERHAEEINAQIVAILDTQQNRREK